MGKKMRFLTNAPAERKSLYTRAARETGFDISVGNRAVEPCIPTDISVWTGEPRGTNRSPFWRRVEELKRCKKRREDTTATKAIVALCKELGLSIADLTKEWWKSK